MREAKDVNISISLMKRKRVSISDKDRLPKPLFDISRHYIIQESKSEQRLVIAKGMVYERKETRDKS